ncbi:hypothetical protein PXK58_19565 [Phaeobacter gallaeciensis]|uniref:hypothetical protein n=1 Tax=Phaeobacter gallaeciensis TaxID=60890 RepID=UPI0023801035|nr:hypothetical protein [Phaeobacter gallaeciensis]MDE4276510.1 hypothetical protein [Phaeobacter gallaeciensis]MDE4301749.1 hypothetical protein [Phaeobacter gallaeciensis]MDE5186902.1 hypothetical protein [Phaeobacter gallaeciensis]
MKDDRENLLQSATCDGAPVPEIGLAVVQHLLDRLHAADLQYCHWKSNEHLDAGMRGLTDLDVLVEQWRGDDLQRILAESGFRRFQATALTAYPAVEDYLAVDDATGTLVHLHLHHRLTLGQKHLKGYRLPWEAQALATRRFDPTHGAYVTAPEMELLLLLVRDALKRRIRTTVAAWIRVKGGNDDFEREFAWLVERAEADAVVSLAVRLIGPKTEAPLRRILADGARHSDRAAFAKVVRAALRPHRTYGAISAALFMKVREIFWILGGLSRRRFHWAIPLRRTSPRGGIVVAFLGSDGAGKSTMRADTMTWLGQKLDVVPIYFGSGDGPGSLLRLPLQIARRLVDRRAVSGTPSQRRSGLRGRLRAVALIPWALSLSLEKRAKLRRMIRARNRGLVVIGDRYPQDQFQGFNDGCLLGRFASSSSRLAQALARWEARAYADARLYPPDVVIKLIASPEVALSRRPEMSAEEIENRIEVVRALRFPDETLVAEIDADQPLDEVVRSVRRVIWKVL